MNQMAFGKTKSDNIKESVQDVLHIAKIVTSPETEGSTSSSLVGYLPETSPQNFVEKGSKESKDDVVQQDGSSDEAIERLEKSLDIGQNTPFQDNDGKTTVGQSVGEIANPPLELVEKESSNKVITMDQMAFRKTKSNNLKESVQEGSTSHITNIATSSGIKRSTSALLVASFPETSPPDFVGKRSKESISKDEVQQDEGNNEAGERLEKPSNMVQKNPSQAPIEGLQTRTYLDQDPLEDSLDLYKLMGDIFSLFGSMEKDDQLVAKAFHDLETYLNMPLKDIANFDSNSEGIVNALEILSSWYSRNGSSMEELEATIDSLLQNLPSLLSSFEQASATIGKFTMLEERHKSIMEELPRRKEVANTLEKSIVDAQQKKANLKENFDRLLAELKSTENEIEEHEAHLSSLKEHGKKLYMETVNFSKEFEIIKKDKSEMVEDRRRAHEQLLRRIMNG